MMDRETSGLVRIRAAERLELERISEMTRQPMSWVASEAIRYALNHCELHEVKMYDLTFGGKTKMKRVASETE